MALISLMFIIVQTDSQRVNSCQDKALRHGLHSDKCNPIFPLARLNGVWVSSVHFRQSGLPSGAGFAASSALSRASSFLIRRAMSSSWRNRTAFLRHSAVVDMAVPDE